MSSHEINVKLVYRLINTNYIDLDLVNKISLMATLVLNNMQINLNMKNLSNHPATILGRWLKEHRTQKGIVASRFAESIEIEAAKYAEIELGITTWITPKIMQLIGIKLQFASDQYNELRDLLSKANETETLELSDIFSRDDLKPIRMRSDERYISINSDQSQELLDSVFSPIPA